MIFKRIVFFGSIRTAKNCLKIVSKNLEFQEIIIVTETRKKNIFMLGNTQRKKNYFFSVIMILKLILMIKNSI